MVLVLLNRMLPFLVVGLLSSEMGRLAFGSFNGDMFGGLARFFFCVLCIAGLKSCTLRERLLFAGAVGLALVALRSEGSGSVIISALDLAAFFGAFIVSLTLMKEAAERSGSILAVGRFLTSQPPGRRFYAIALGGHTLGVFLNFGAISLMSPLIQNGARDADGHIDPAIERRQFSALLRGFSWILLWAPTTLTQAVLLTLFPDVDYLKLLATGIGTSVLMIFLGRICDKFEWPGGAVSGPEVSVKPPEVPKQEFLVVAGICGALIATTFLLMAVTGFSVAQALIFVAPMITVSWLAMQGDAPAALRRFVVRLAGAGPIFRAATPGLARSAIALGLSGFIGRVAAQVLPVADIAAAVDFASVPCWLFLASLPILITASGQIALSPILVVVFLGEVLKSVPELPADATQIVYALSAGWALSMTASPNATATLLISATCNISPTTLTWRWNGRYAVLCYGALVLLFIAMC